LALEAHRRGAEVILVHRFIQDIPVRQIYAESAKEMLDAVLGERPKGYDALIGVAAVADYTLDASVEKIKSGQDLVLKLKTTKKILRTARDAYPNLRIVGFKAETNLGDELLVASAKKSLLDSRLDLVVANDVGRRGMGTEENRVLIIYKEGTPIVAEGKKSKIARLIIDALIEVL
jgi:phosphopantothenoylcysteine decarboxylase/phosphopantothenate--cysteine ligase